MINGINAYNNNSVQKNNASEQLASGKRVNSAKDDAAGLQIINRLTSEINGSSQYVSNSLDAINLISTSDGVLDNITQDAQRIRELTIQSGSGLNTQADIDAIQSEINQLTSNISNTVSNTEFNDQKLLNNNFSFGVNEGSTIDINTNVNDSLNIDLSDPQQALEDIDSFLESVGSERSILGAQANGIESNVSNLLTNNEIQSAARSRIQDTDYAKQAGQNSINKVLENVNILIQKKEESQKGNLLNLLA